MSLFKKIPLLLSMLFFIHSATFAQLRKGFDPQEAKDLLAIYNSYTFLDLYGSDSVILPKNYIKIFTSEVVGLDNRFQIYENAQTGVINFRGSTSEVSSWIENMYSAMIACKGMIIIDQKEYPYKFAMDTAASVHAGYALAMVFLGPILLDQINKMETRGIHNFLLTGHSQGGALASLCHAYLKNLPKDIISSKTVIKTYAFANPMFANKAFSEEYQFRYGEAHMNYTIVNPADLVPQMPVHYQEEGSLLSFDRLKNWVTGEETFDIRQFGMSLFVRTFERGLTSYINFSNKQIEKFVWASYANIVMPEYKRDINYFTTGTIKELKPFQYPKILLSPSQMTEEEKIKIKPDENGNFFKKESAFYQHKPYNYYTAVLKEYFPKEYRSLEMKYLPENL